MKNSPNNKQTNIPRLDFNCINEVMNGLVWNDWMYENSWVSENEWTYGQIAQYAF